ncbi:uncharacterized protein TRUGW13939_04040 [Talaromyces rugulosus]|uniref:Fungal-specific transcription factor domain-containing protein n=1 Tax=Talaromyces rugulosus TaxID=121627 RepID=A0A7H8QSL5_TALRU|nr:uncharacterized protein TRUGW13939_04040 [Talaromyces rugulosus]QKX56932.1 hypothetical protein TRUGW13939_04040 [Talaromyces rugulosus]
MHRPQIDSRQTQHNALDEVVKSTGDAGPSPSVRHEPSSRQLLRIEKTPVPSPYLANKHSRLTMHQLVAKTATTVFPLASRSFVDRLIVSAVENLPLLYALLACFGNHHARRTIASSSESEETTLTFTNHAIAGLRAALNSKTMTAETLMTAMTLCTNDVCNGNLDVFRIHLKAIRQMLSSFINTLPAGEKSPDQDLLNVYLMKWFAALDVSASLSLFYQNQQNDQQKFLSWNNHQFFNPSDDVVDDICGYSLNLVPIFSKIGCLARIQYERSSTIVDQEKNTQSACSPLDLTDQTQSLETRLESLPSPRISVGVWTSQQRELVEELRDTHPAFVHTALLHLHRRVQLLSKCHPKVRKDVTSILRVVKKVRPFSPANVLLIWPLFSAGCETDSTSERAVIDERMSIMQSLGMGNFTRGREALHKYWESGTSLRWDVFLAQSGIDLVLF